MNTLLLLCAALGVTTTAGAGSALRVAPASAPFNPDRFLWAIAQVETGGENTKVGDVGERSAWQLTHATWRDYTRVPFTFASTDRELARRVAVAHLRWLRAQFFVKNIPENVATLAAAWRYGLNHAVVCQRTESVERVGNLYNSSHKHTE